MRKNFLQFFIFLFIFLLMYYGVYFLLFSIEYQKKPLIYSVQEIIPLSKGTYGKTLKEFDPFAKYDIVFMGSSHSRIGFNPKNFEEMGLKTFNLGSPSQSPINTFALLEKYIHGTKNVVLEVFPVVSGNTGRESFFKLVPTIDDFSVLFQMALYLNDLRCYNILSLKPLIDRYNQQNIKTDSIQEIVYKGFVEMRDSAKEDLKYSTWTLSSINLEKQLIYIKKITELCKHNMVGICLVYNPVPKELKINNEKQFIQSIEKIAQQENIRFYNYGHNHKLHSKHHFFDDNHLNYAGVTEFNKALIEKMLFDKFIQLNPN